MKMLTEERYTTILAILAERKAITVPELTKLLKTSESTIRRDLTVLHSRGKLHKVYGGATSIDTNYSTDEADVLTKNDLNKESKIAIARLAAKLIGPNDFVYLDAGTTTEWMIDFINVNHATFVTNGMGHAMKLAFKGYTTYIVSGRVKTTTAAIVGSETIENIKKYNFTKGFFGTNCISIKAGFTTPDVSEGAVKNEAILRCEKCYVLADASKFNKIAPITFANLSSATIITDKLKDKKYRDYTNIIEVENHDLHGNV